MSNGEIIISVVTAVLVVFCVAVSVIIPKRDPSFPGRRNLVAFGLVCLVLVGGTFVTVEIYGSEEGHGAEAAAEGGHGEGEGEGEGVPPPADEAPPPAGAPPATPGDPFAGTNVYITASCGSCHALADAGTTGTIGPNLDETQPSFELTVDRVTNGAGAMPAFAGQLSPLEIDDVAAYVVAATSG